MLALPNCVAFDLATPVEVFGRAWLADGSAGYRVRVCGSEPIVDAGPMRIATEHGLNAPTDADTIVVPGCNDVGMSVPDAVISALKAAYASGIRMSSICSGAFTLAAAGILDGKRATTHWIGAEAFRAAYPAVELDADVPYVDAGQVFTSAGASAGLDLCLHMVARDCGAAVAADAARLAVVPLHRDGGQAQFIVRNRHGANTALDATLAWIDEHVRERLSLRDIAAHANTSTRTLIRRFQAETGLKPIQWVTGVRVRHAQELLERTSDSVESIGYRVGFESAANFRAQFKQIAQVPPRLYRNVFRDRTND